MLIEKDGYLALGSEYPIVQNIFSPLFAKLESNVSTDSIWDTAINWWIFIGITEQNKYLAILRAQALFLDPVYVI